jgi:putative PIN family toxin of toxin-antitoxin system
MPDALTAVIDSTVLVSAFLTKGGVSAELLRYAREGVFLVFFSDEILTETEHTLSYPRIRARYTYTDEDVTDFLDRLRVAAQLITDLPRLTGIVRDPNDDMVIATARRANAAYIVTRDDDLLSLQQYEDISILTPEAFIAIVREYRHHTDENSTTL